MSHVFKDPSPTSVAGDGVTPLPTNGASARELWLHREMEVA